MTGETSQELLEAEPMMEHFTFAHLTGAMRDTSERFYSLARYVVVTLPRTPERTVALRKILEGKDAAVRCALAVARAAGDSRVDRPRAGLDSPAPRMEDPGRPPAASDG